MRTGSLVYRVLLFCIGKPGWLECKRQSAGRGSGSRSEKQAVEGQTKAAEEKQRREVLRHHRKDGSWQGNLKGTGVPSGEIVNHAREQHIEKAAAHLVPPVRSPALRHLHLRNRFAAERTLPHLG